MSISKICICYIVVRARSHPLSLLLFCAVFCVTERQPHPLFDSLPLCGWKANLYQKEEETERRAAEAIYIYISYKRRPPPRRIAFAKKEATITIDARI